MNRFISTIFLIPYVYAAAAKSLQSCLTLCNPMDCSPPGFSVHGISRQEHWITLPFPPPGGLNSPVFPALQMDSLPMEPNVCSYWGKKKMNPSCNSLTGDIMVLQGESECNPDLRKLFQLINCLKQQLLSFHCYLFYLD